MNEFYVYALLDPRQPCLSVYGKFLFPYRPFYVGKGKGRRCFQHEGEARRAQGRVNRRHGFLRALTRQGYSPIVVKLYHGCTEQQAYDLEMQCISTIGRFSEGGPLTNHSEGGGVSSGWRHTEEWKEFMSVIHTGRTYGPEVRKRMSLGKKGIPFSEAHKKALAESKLGRSMSDSEYAEYVQARDHRHTREELSEIKSTNGKRRWSTKNQEERAKILSRTHEGRDRPEVKARITAKTRERNATVKNVQCPHCQKTGQEYAMKRWHFDNCREKTNASIP